MFASKPTPLTVDQWSPVATARAELIDGTEDMTRTFESSSMQATSIRHARACARVRDALSNAIRSAGLACEALPEGPVVAVSASRGRVPDVSVSCMTDTDPDALTFEPCVVVEVLSQSTASADHGAKVREYLSVGFIARYLVIDAQEHVVTHYQPHSSHVIRYSEQTHEITLDPPGISISLADLFDYSTTS